MILVLLGTQNNSFHRLLEEIDRLIKKGVIKDEVVVQAGYTKYMSENLKVVNLIPQEELEKLQDEADLIITHGGVGSIVSSIKKGKKVIAVPRLHKYDEHVNDHQKDIIKKFADEGNIIGINSVDELEEALEKSKEFKPKEYKGNNEKMLNIIETYIDSLK